MLEFIGNREAFSKRKYNWFKINQKFDLLN